VRRIRAATPPFVIREHVARKSGNAVRVGYCFGSMPANPWTRPWRLNLALDNRRDGQPPLSIAWKIPERCGTILHPVGGIKAPYTLRYYVESARDTRSRVEQIAVQTPR